MTESAKSSNISVSLLTRIIVVGITLFYGLSAAGWYMSSIMMLKGQIPLVEAKAFYQSLSLLDHLVRTAQVVTITIAAIQLLLYKLAAYKLFVWLTLSSAIATLIDLLYFGSVRWSISFLGGLQGLLILVLAVLYLRGLAQRGILRNGLGQTQN